MPLVSTSTKTLQIKVVYYGPGLSGKTTNLEKLNTLLSKNRVGDLMSLDTSGDRTLYFDWMPVELGKIKGFDVKIQLYTVPGQVRYNNTRKQVLSGVDGIVFVADSQRAAADQNVYSYNNLKENLEILGIDMEEIPMVIQCNKKDLPDTMTTRELAVLLKAEHRPFIEAIASSGKGVLETLRLATRITMKKIQKYLDPRTAASLENKTDESDYDGDVLLSKIMESESQNTEQTKEQSKEMPENIKYTESLEIEAEPSDGDPEIDETTSIEFQSKIAPKLKDNPFASEPTAVQSPISDTSEINPKTEKIENDAVKHEKIEVEDDDKTPIPVDVSYVQTPKERPTKPIEKQIIKQKQETEFIKEIRKEFEEKFVAQQKQTDKLELMLKAQQKEILRLRNILQNIADLIKNN